MLEEKLRELNEKSKSVIPEETLAVMGRALRKLQETHIEEKTIKTGEMLPDFTLIDSQGKTYTREGFKDKKLVLNFFRGSW